MTAPLIEHHRVSYNTAAIPLSVEVSDFNGDGKPDLAVGGDAVSVFIGNGDGTFKDAVNYSAPGYLTVGDFNNDGKLDVTTPGPPGSTTMGYLLLNTCTSSGVGLAAARRNSGIALSWPAPSTDMVLESATGLSITNWQPVAETPTTNGSRLEVTVPLDQPQRFFRLHKP